MDINPLALYYALMGLLQVVRTGVWLRSPATAWTGIEVHIRIDKHQSLDNKGTTLTIGITRIIP